MQCEEFSVNSGTTAVSVFMSVNHELQFSTEASDHLNIEAECSALKGKVFRVNSSSSSEK